MHIGIIPDGNRRFAHKNNINKKEAYKIGYDLILNMIHEVIEHRHKIMKIIDEKYGNIELNFNVKELTIYVCSLDNLTNRDKEDTENIYRLIKKFLKYYEVNKDFIMKHKIKIVIIGDLNKIDTLLKENLNKIMLDTYDNTHFTLNLAIAYSGKWEINNMVKEIVDIKSLLSNKNINDDIIRDHMKLKNDIDIVIRTGFEKRMSDFFPYQTVYSEWFFIDKYWPELTFEDLLSIIKEYQFERKRRFGY